MAFNLQGVNTALGSTVNNLGQRVQSQMNANRGGDMTEVEMINLQHEMNRWSMMVNMQTNIMKTMSDGMKSIISNMR